VHICEPAAKRANAIHAGGKRSVADKVGADVLVGYGVSDGCFVVSTSLLNHSSLVGKPVLMSLSVME
jgi:hypothetical protein